MSIALFHLVFDVLFMLGLTARRAVLVSQRLNEQLLLEAAGIDGRFVEGQARDV